jgi:hypothetical protein
MPSNAEAAVTLQSYYWSPPDDVLTGLKVRLTTKLSTALHVLKRRFPWHEWSARNNSPRWSTAATTNLVNNCLRQGNGKVQGHPNKNNLTICGFAASANLESSWCFRTKGSLRTVFNWYLLDHWTNSQIFLVITRSQHSIHVLNLTFVGYSRRKRCLFRGRPQSTVISTVVKRDLIVKVEGQRYSHFWGINLEFGWT